MNLFLEKFSIKSSLCVQFCMYFVCPVLCKIQTSVKFWISIYMYHLNVHWNAREAGRFSDTRDTGCKHYWWDALIQAVIHTAFRYTQLVLPPSLSFCWWQATWLFPQHACKQLFQLYWFVGIFPFHKLCWLLWFEKP